MPAVSEKQARFMRMVYARKKGHDVGGPMVGKAAKSMSMDDAHDYMHTAGGKKSKRKGYAKLRPA